ncbi:hypothetical protein O6H91_21G058600 [Diphasiastrum complanatum]|uniref:Uncharacterized protein n=11 Tax=Diphasiastrum complanatum TaxID=34168 RepID=A0ACC2AMM3_DIPCM|nr:hypothetical protein O6H91_21G058600 [Diphasiastrum complanatum]KAJ7518183.1 hypothetical protein O6H91_21G058600 [Diphasiastrum complanatum]KAJ7518184.1 hypothetical protein O6H91_21G058600 [Diphasiastrum complanatum]KAJ7518185.1 hypothetical protein O6H91_21G058600 [Diphasiastrum complanatum]KAJ7518186.1 hypothetical protein O6H91_21G058600 [Diphasiastrum complanatum]
MSTEPFRRLVKLVARAFYDEEIPAKGPNRSKSDKSDNRGIAIVILDALTRRQWVKEEDLARDLKLHPKQLRRTLRVLEEEQLVVREDHRETVKAAKAYNAAIAATSDGKPGEQEKEEKQKVHTHSYCCLDYAQVYDVVRYRIHRAKKKIKDELEDRNTVQEYVCPNPSCGSRYSALDALQLVNPFDQNFHCERCDSELVAESDKLAAVELADGDGDDNARRRQREKLRELLEKMEIQLKPLMEQLARVKDLTPPDYGTFTQWEKKAIASGRIVSSNGEVPELKVAHGQGPTGTPMPFLGETKVEVALAGAEDSKEHIKEEVAATAKVLPPWMIRQGMNVPTSYSDGRHEVKTEEGLGLANSTALDVKPVEDKEAIEQKLKEEYYKAYYAALLQRQQEAAQVHTVATVVTDEQVTTHGQEIATSDRQVGMKSKRDEREEEEEEVEWEDASVSGGLHAVNEDATEGGLLEEQTAVEPGVGDEGDDEEIDWEDG